MKRERAARAKPETAQLPAAQRGNPYLGVNNPSAFFITFNFPVVDEMCL